LKGRRDSIPALRRKGSGGKKKAGKNISFFVWKKKIKILTLSSQKQNKFLKEI
jgi:hypothetical protein